MQVGGSPHRAQLAIAEGTGDGQVAELLPAEAHIPIGMAIEAGAPAEAGKQQGRQGLGLLLLLEGQQLAQFLAGGGAIAQLELHLLPHPHPFGHGHGAIAGVHPHQVAHQKGRAPVAAGGVEAKAVVAHAQEEGMFHQLPLLGSEVGEDGLECRHGRVALIALAELQHHVALGLLHFKHRTDRPAALGHHRIEAPGPIDQTAHGAAPDPLIKQQRAVGGAVGAGDSAQFHRCRTGVIQARDQVVDAAEAWIDQQQHRVIARLRRGTHQGSPGIGRTIQIRQ